MVRHRTDPSALWIHGESEGECKNEIEHQLELDVLANSLNAVNFSPIVAGSGPGHISADHVVPTNAVCAVFCVYPACDLSSGSYCWDIDANMAGKFVVCCR